MSTGQIREAVRKIAKSRFLQAEEIFSHLDIGAGEGHLIAALKRDFLNIQSQACDYHVDRFPLESVPIKKVDLNREPLPFGGAVFDLVTFSEVIEHLENYHQLLRETYRVLKPGGLLILTTPNILNIRSRIRYFISGFHVLFGPLPLSSEEVYSTHSHINPVSYFYLAHSLLKAGFERLEMSRDKIQRTSVAGLLLFGAAPGLFWPLFWRRELRAGTIGANQKLVAVHRSWKLLTSRSLVMSAQKPSPG